MKKGIFFMLMCLIFFAGCGQKMSAWILGNEKSLVLRTGYNVSETVEIGIESIWFDGIEELGGQDVPQAWGAYSIFRWQDTINITNIIPLDFLPKELTARPYIGGHAGLNLAIDRASYAGPIAGISLQDVLDIEWQYTIADYKLEDIDHVQRIIIGPHFKF